MRTATTPPRPLDEIQELGNVAEAERAFYSRYAWCLNPIQSLDQLFQRILEECDSYDGLQLDWQQEEARINLFLLSCAVSCSVADYLTPELLPRIAARSTALRLVYNAAEQLLQAGHGLRNSLLKPWIWNWKQEWDQCVELSCCILLNERNANSGEISRLRSQVEALADRALPESLRNVRMQLPSGFRAQDLTHRDVLALADAFDSAAGDNRQTLAIVGARTAGAYFAPLIKTRLQQRGWQSVSWISVRPKRRLSAWEERYLRSMARKRTHIMIVDDHPDTGETLRLMIDRMGELGVQRRYITVVVPSHPAQSDRAALTGGYSNVHLVTVPAEEADKSQRLVGKEIERLLREYMAADGWDNIRVIDDLDTQATNHAFQEQLRDGFQIRLKRVFRVQCSAKSGARSSKRVIAKSVGWGWLAYHGYLAGSRLHEYVPKVLGLRSGLLFSHWIEASAQPREPTQDQLADRVAAYVAARRQLLGIGEDPCLEQPHYGSTGWDVMAKALRRAYGPYIGWLQMGALRAALKRYAAPSPTFVDAQMGPEEWLDTGTQILKVDYEQHGFGNLSPNIVDPAYDLASAAFQLALSPSAQQRLLRHYIKLTGDAHVHDRFFLYKLVRGQLALTAARYWSNRAGSDQQHQGAEADYLNARNFLVAEMSRFCSERFSEPKSDCWSRRLFFLDLDGVFDCNKFGFPHTTISGMAALALLKRHGYSIVLNTGRSLEHVRHYCSDYGLCGGIAEYGCVFLDAISHEERCLIHPQDCEQLGRVRSYLANVPGIILDPGYHYAVRAYQVESGCATPLPSKLLQQVLKDKPGLTFHSDVETTILPAHSGKGSAAARVMEQFSVAREASAAIGDSDMDMPMLERVQNGYVPANASTGLIRLARRSGYRVLGAPFQRDLLQAVEELTGDSRASLPHISPHGKGGTAPIIEVLLDVAEKSTMQQLRALLKDSVLRATG